MAALAVAGMFAWQQMNPPQQDSRDIIDGVNNNSVIPARAGISQNKTETVNPTVPAQDKIKQQEQKLTLGVAVLPFENLSRRGSVHINLHIICGISFVGLE